MKRFHPASNFLFAENHAAMHCPSPTRIILALCCLIFLSITPVVAAEVRVITPDSEPLISGKELDWIYGDYLMKNDHLSLVIAAPIPSRDANMTIKGIGASILDLTLNQPSNDQLSAYIPTSGRYLFQDPKKIETGRKGETVFWQCDSSRTIAKDGTTATVRYELTDGDPFVQSTIVIKGDAAQKVVAFDGVRADGWFSFDRSDCTAYCSDVFFRQTIGFRSPLQQTPPEWQRGRPYRLRYSGGHVERSQRSLRWTVLLYPATSPLDLFAVAGTEPIKPFMQTFTVKPANSVEPNVDTVNRAQVVVRSADQEADFEPALTTLQTDDQGIAHARLAPGEYFAVATAIGYESVEVAFTVNADSRLVTLDLGKPSGFNAEVIDAQGNPIPVKATIYAIDGNHPNYGLRSARTFVENLVYSVHGRMHCPLDPGEYEIYFSRGPEYDCEKRQFAIVRNEMKQIKVQLERVVDTTGWISGDLHSHSTPSGDNTSDQYGRVENLLCEHVEFAPCTEHNRISSYAPHLDRMKLSHLMATCTGIELTGSPTPVNHQNAFPLHRHPHTQNGGGPRAASNPVVQIERLAMWDSKSDKLVQMNHPNLHQIYGDLDTDGVPDKGFRGMLEWADVLEVHPLETIFQDVVSEPPSVRRMRIPLFQWMQLLNQGERIPGVINTDSHYNHHGSGWRRNWFASSTDDPAEISTDEMVHQIEAGHIVMSNGPFLTVLGRSESSSETAMPGDELIAPSGQVAFHVMVQCPNWFDINRVQIFVNGRPSEKHHVTRKNDPKLFGQVGDVVKFDSTFNLTLEEDAHVIVATIGEGMTMEKVMGRRYGRRSPIAVSNPIFVDVRGDGFQPNGDELGLPLPRVSDAP